MPAFASQDQAAAVLTQLFEILLQDERFESTVRQENLTVLFKHSDPELTVFLHADGVAVDTPPASHPAITIQM